VHVVLAFRAVRTLEGGVLGDYVAAFLDMLVAHAERWETAYLNYHGIKFSATLRI
jgi:hypothetical protein